MFVIYIYNWDGKLHNGFGSLLKECPLQHENSDNDYTDECSTLVWHISRSVSFTYNTWIINWRYSIRRGSCGGSGLVRLLACVATGRDIWWQRWNW